MAQWPSICTKTGSISSIKRGEKGEWEEGGERGVCVGAFPATLIEKNQKLFTLTNNKH